MRTGKAFQAVLVGLAILASSGPAARAAIILEQYSFANQPGNQTSVASSFTAAGLSGLAFTESSVLTPSAAAGFISTSGWNNAGAAYSFGFNVAAGQSVTATEIDLASRSSGTGPGFLNILASVDGAAAVVVATLTQSGTTYNDLLLAITPVTARRSLVFSIVAANSTSAAGGTTAGTGTFRIGDYAPGGVTASPFTIQGTITPTTTAVPEPASCLLLGVSLIGGLVVSRRRSGR